MGLDVNPCLDIENHGVNHDVYNYKSGYKQRKSQTNSRMICSYNANMGQIHVYDVGLDT